MGIFTDEKINRIGGVAVGVCDKCSASVKMLCQMNETEYFCSSCQRRACKPKKHGTKGKTESKLLFWPAGSSAPYMASPSKGNMVWSVIPKLAQDWDVVCAGTTDCFMYKNRNYHCKKHREQLVAALGKDGYYDTFNLYAEENEIEKA